MQLNDYIKQLYGDKESMTLAELTQAASAAKNAKFVDLSEGGYVDEGKYSNVAAKLTTANQTIQTLQTAVRNFEGVDIQKLQSDLDAERAARAKDRQTWNLQAALVAAGCKDIDYVMYKLSDTVEFADDGSLKDKDGLIESVKKTYSSQFEVESAGGTGGLGNFQRNHGGKEKAITKEEFDKFSYMEKYEFKTQQPDAFRALIAGDTGGN